MTHFLLRAPSGLFLRGVPHARFLRMCSPPDAFEQTCMTWSSISGVSASEDEVLNEMRRSFDWRELLVRAATTLTSMRRQMDHSSGLAASNDTRDALADDWPYAIVAAEEFRAWLMGAAPRMGAMTPAGLLAVMALALRQPWAAPVGRLTGEVASRRFMRLAMVASDLVAPPDREGPFATARVMLDNVRTEVFDHSIGRLARAFELYVELLPLEMPDAAVAFHRSAGLALDDWIVGLCTLNSALETLAEQTGYTKMRLDCSDVAGATIPPWVQAIRAIAVQPSWYASVIAERGLHAVTLFRERPVVALGEEQYVVLHDDYLLTAADEGVVARLKEGLSPEERKQLPNGLGKVFQRYVGSVLRRLFGAAVVADVPTVGGEQRCDFAIRFGDDLLLLDAKCIHLGNPSVDGTDEIDCLARPLRGGLLQILATADAINANGITTVAPSMDAPLNWRPRRRFGWLVVQPDLPIWFTSLRALVEHAPGVGSRWRATITGLPLVLSIAELERLEAAGMVWLRDLLDRLARDEATAHGGISRFLTILGYSGPGLSEAISEKRRQILSRVPG